MRRQQGERAGTISEAPSSKGCSPRALRQAKRAEIPAKTRVQREAFGRRPTPSSTRAPDTLESPTGLDEASVRRWVEGGARFGGARALSPRFSARAARGLRYCPRHAGGERR